MGLFAFSAIKGFEIFWPQNPLVMGKKKLIIGESIYENEEKNGTASDEVVGNGVELSLLSPAPPHPIHLAQPKSSRKCASNRVK